jgi:hypothetical protein
MDHATLIADCDTTRRHGIEMRTCICRAAPRVPQGGKQASVELAALSHSERARRGQLRWEDLAEGSILGYSGQGPRDWSHFPRGRCQSVGRELQKGC